MKKNVFYCNDCNASYGGDAGGEERCPNCRRKLYDTNISVESWKELTKTEKEDYKQKFAVEAEKMKDFYIENKAESIVEEGSAVGSLIKGLSLFMMVLGVIGSFIIIIESFVVGISMLLVLCLFCLLSYGIGEIICLLKGIKNKIDKINL